MPVAVRGVIYPSAHDAAAALGVKVATVYDAISRRDPDTLGLGRSYIPAKNRKSPKAKPVTVAGTKFRSIADLARQIGRKPKDVAFSLRRGEIAHRRVVLAVMKMIAAKEQAEAKRRAEIMLD